MTELLEFVLKGNRNYVQGTSLFNALVNAACHNGHMQGQINVTFKRMLHNPVCVLEQRAPKQSDAVISRITGLNGESLTLCINEANEIAVSVREEFDESAICRGAIVGSKYIVQHNPHHADKIELLVSLCKKMHQECLDDVKKWVFSRYDGLFPIPEATKVELRIVKQVGMRLTCSDVLIDEEKIGEIYFS